MPFQLCPSSRRRGRTGGTADAGRVFSASVTCVAAVEVSPSGHPSGDEDPGVRPWPVGDQSNREGGHSCLGRPCTPEKFVLDGGGLAGESTTPGEKHGEGPGESRLQRDGQQGGDELVDPVPGEAVRGERPSSAGAQHRRVLRAVVPAGRNDRCMGSLHAFTERGDRGWDDLQKLGGLRADLGQRLGEHFQRRGCVLAGAGTPPARSGGVCERTHRDHRALSQRVHAPGAGGASPVQGSVIESHQSPCKMAGCMTC